MVSSEGSNVQIIQGLPYSNNPVFSEGTFITKPGDTDFTEKDAYWVNYTPNTNGVIIITYYNGLIKTTSQFLSYNTGISDLRDYGNLFNYCQADNDIKYGIWDGDNRDYEVWKINLASKSMSLYFYYSHDSGTEIWASSNLGSILYYFGFNSGRVYKYTGTSSESKYIDFSSWVNLYSNVSILCVDDSDTFYFTAQSSTGVAADNTVLYKYIWSTNTWTGIFTFSTGVAGLGVTLYILNNCLYAYYVYNRTTPKMQYNTSLNGTVWSDCLVLNTSLVNTLYASYAYPWGGYKQSVSGNRLQFWFNLNSLQFDFSQNAYYKLPPLTSQLGETSQKKIPYTINVDKETFAQASFGHYADANTDVNYPEGDVLLVKSETINGKYKLEGMTISNELLS